MNSLIELLITLPTSIIYVITTAVVITAIAVVIAVIRFGINVRKGDVNIKIGGRNKDSISISSEKFDKMLRLIVSTVQDIQNDTAIISYNKKNIPATDIIDIIYGLYKQSFFLLLAEKQVKEALITCHNDYNTFELIIKNIMYSLNGQKSLKSIIQDAIKSKLYVVENTTDFNKFVNGIYMQFSTAFNKVVEPSYRNQIIFNEEMEFRKITVEEIYSIHENLKSKVLDYLKEIFEKCIEADIEIENKSELNIETRINELKGVIGSAA